MLLEVDVSGIGEAAAGPQERLAPTFHLDAIGWPSCRWRAEEIASLKSLLGLTEQRPRAPATL
jgi:hypothetical protein